jgi:superfamily II DNA or RNA helicase
VSETIHITKVNETYVRIDAEQSILYELSERFTFVVPNAHFIPAVRNKMWDGKIRLLDLRSRQLYFGLHHYVKEYADQNGYECVYSDAIDTEVEFSVVEARKMFDALKLSTMCDDGVRRPITPHDYQERAVIHGIQGKRTLLLSPTASGKSLMIYVLLRYYLAKAKKKILVVVPNKALVTQLFHDFDDYSALIPWDAEENCHLIYDGNEKDTEKPIVIATWQSLAVKERLTQDQKRRRVKAEYKLEQSYFDEFGVVFGDECHLFTSKELTNMMSKLVNCRYRIGTTGTLKDSKTNIMVLEGLFGPVYQTITTRELMDNQTVADLTIKCLQLLYPAEQRKEMKRATYPEEMDFLVAHAARNRFIRNLALSLKGNTLVLFQYVEKHGAVLHELIQSKIADGRKLFYVHGKTEVEDRDAVRHITEGENDAIIVASYGTFSTGINIRNIDNIIFHVAHQEQDPGAPVDWAWLAEVATEEQGDPLRHCGRSDRRKCEDRQYHMD